MISEIVPARIIAPGRILERELEARGWTQKDLADIMKRPGQAINEIVRGTKRIVPETAVELAAALGTSAEFWINLEANYRLALAKNGQVRGRQARDIERRSALYTLAPVAELIKHQWIRGSSNTDVLEREVFAFLGISRIAEIPAERLAFRFRCSQTREPNKNAQYAWIRRVTQVAVAQPQADFRHDVLHARIGELLQMTINPSDAARVRPLLLALGIHFVIVPHLRQTYLDGGALVVEGRPVVALTLRYDRLDSFWFTLLHELAHISLNHLDPDTSNGTAIFLDDFDHAEPDITGVHGQEVRVESEANAQASRWLLAPDALDDFIDRNGANISLNAIQRFAREQHRHPSIVLGQLQYRKLVDYTDHRSLMTKVRPHLRDWIDVA